MRKNWFRLEVSGDDAATAEVYILDIIGDWIDDLIGWAGNGITTAKSFMDELAKLPASVKTIRVHINSPGGDVFSAATIANALRDQQTSKGRTVETIIDGLAASAASVIAMAGSRVSMADNALFMIHDPWTGLYGNARQLRAEADRLDTVRDTIVSTYQWHTELEADEIAALMKGPEDGDGTWMTAAEALEKGFVTDIIEGLRAAALLDPKAMARMKVPEQYRDRVEAFMAKPEPAPAAAGAGEVLRLCREGGCLEVAESLLQEGATVDQVTARVGREREARQRAAARETEIRGLCAAARLPELADGYIQGGMAAAQVRTQLTFLTAKLDKVEIDGGLNPDQGGRKKPVIDTVAIYAERNKLRAPQTKE